MDNKLVVRPRSEAQNINVMPPSDMLRQSDVAAMTKELFDPKKIGMTTELNQTEINLITAMEVIAEQKGLRIWSDIARGYMERKLSLKRKSRSELLDAYAAVAKRKNLMSRIKEVFRPEE